MTRLTRCSISVSKMNKENICSVNSKKYYKKSLAMKIGSWNVRTLLRDTRSAAARPERRTALVARELGRLGIDILLLSPKHALLTKGNLMKLVVVTPFSGRGLKKVKIVSMALVSQLRQI